MYVGSSGLVVIHDGNFHTFRSPVVAGETRKTGLIPRDYAKNPVGSIPGIKSGIDMPLIPESQWPTLLQQMDAEGTGLDAIRERGMFGQRIPSRDQNGRGYCWMHSGVGALLLVRARDGQPYADLSAYGPACVIKNFRDEGGWGAQGVDFLRERGCPTSATWPQQGTSRSYDNPNTWAEAAKYKVDEGWIDLQAAQYDRKMAWNQYMTCWFNCQPTINDYNWWGHSVCGMRPVNGSNLFNQGLRSSQSHKLITTQELDAAWDFSDPVTAGMGCLILNSWGDSWSQNGAGVLAPSKAVPDGGVALCTAYASA